MDADWFREALAEAAMQCAQAEVLFKRELTVWEGFDILGDVIQDKP